MTTRRLLAFALSLTFTFLVGRLLDATTGQPLGGVSIRLDTGAHRLRTRTGADGRFILKNVPPGKHALHASSRDVPPQTLPIRVHGRRQTLLLHACSTTLDYRCGNAGAGGA